MFRMNNIGSIIGNKIHKRKYNVPVIVNTSRASYKNV